MFRINIYLQLLCIECELNLKNIKKYIQSKNRRKTKTVMKVKRLVRSLAKFQNAEPAYLRWALLTKYVELL